MANFSRLRSPGLAILCLSNFLLHGWLNLVSPNFIWFTDNIQFLLWWFHRFNFLNGLSELLSRHLLLFSIHILVLNNILKLVTNSILLYWLNVLLRVLSFILQMKLIFDLIIFRNRFELEFPLRGSVRFDGVKFSILNNIWLSGSNLLTILNRIVRVLSATGLHNLLMFKVIDIYSINASKVIKRFPYIFLDSSLSWKLQNEIWLNIRTC